MKRWLDARPHHNPLPRGEGTGSVNALGFVCFFSQSSRSFSTETAGVSPSPGGEGRGEGERFTNFAPAGEFTPLVSKSGAEPTAVQTLRVCRPLPFRAKRLDYGAFTAAFSRN